MDRVGKMSGHLREARYLFPAMFEKKAESNPEPQNQ
jgi:hypothetical protein